MCRTFLVCCAAALVLAAPASAASRKPCRPARAARCLRAVRGHEPVIVATSGWISRADALQAFVQTVGPLPGVAVQPGAVDRRMFSSLSGPLRWAAAYLRTMSRAQRAAFRRLLGGGGGSRAHVAANPKPAQVQKWTQAAQTAAALLAQHFGVSLTSAPALPIVVKLMSTPDPDGAASQAAAEPIDKNGNWATGLGPGVSCRIQVFPIAWQSSDPDLPITAVSHEVVHCFQFKLGSTSYATVTASPWLLEGGAEWAGDQVAKEALGHDPHDALLGKYWDGYLKFPATGLFSRVYDAVGFFAHLAETSGSSGAMWPTLRTMFQSIGDPVKAYGFAVPDSNVGFLDSWASGYARAPGLGPGWDTTGIGITASKPPIPLFGGSSALQVSLDAGPRSNALARVNVAGQVFTVGGSGGTPFGRLRDAAGDTYSLEPGAYCVSGANCTCPAGSDGFGDTLPTIAAGVAWVALSGNNSAVHLTLARTSAAAWCKHPVDYNPPVGSSQITVGGAATGTSYAGGRNDSCTLHQQNPFPPGQYLQCFFEIAEPGTSAIAQLSFSTFHYQGPGTYEITTRGTTVWPDAGFTDLANSFGATQMPMDANAGGFSIGAINGNTVAGSLSVSMEDVTQPGVAANVASASGSFSVPLQIAP